jgi:hypothetical protein
MEDDEVRNEEEVGSSVSRRRVLKRAGVGAAIVWSAPALTSLSSPAFAQASPLCETINPFCSPPDVGPLCEEVGCQPQGCPFGTCTRTLDGSCLCWGAVACTGHAPVCETDADCLEPGAKCAAVTDCPTNPCAGLRACFFPCTPGPASLGALEAQHKDAIIVYANG